LRPKKKGTRKKARVSKKKASTRQQRRKKLGGQSKVATLDTFGSWLSTQQKKRRSNEKKMGNASVPNTMEEWLRNQKPAIVEVEQVEVVVPISTTELWLRGQIESRKSEAEGSTSEVVVTSPD
jgi:hypothetical protein